MSPQQLFDLFCWFFVPLLSLDFCAHTSFNSLYAPVKVPLEQQQEQQQCSYCCLCSFCRHTRTHVQQTPSACLYVCMRIMRSSTSAQQQLSLSVFRLALSLALSLSLSHSLSFDSAILTTFLHLISFCAKGVARPLLLLFCIHTRTHTHARTLTLKCTRRTVAAAQCTWLFCGTFPFRHVPFFCKLPTTFFFSFAYSFSVINCYVHTYTHARDSNIYKIYFY